MTYHLFTRLLLATLGAGLLALVYWIASQTLLTNPAPAEDVPEWSSISLAPPSVTVADPDTKPALKDESLLQPVELEATASSPEGLNQGVPGVPSSEPSANAANSLPGQAPATAATPGTPAPSLPSSPAR